MPSAFKTLDWVQKTNIYEVNVRQYTHEGTFNAFAKHLSGLKDMGVHTLWFMPIHPIGKIKRLGTLGSYYSISDHKAINPEFGTVEDFKALVNEAHQMGFKIMIDWVANHTAWDHVWTKEHPEFYLQDAEARLNDEVGQGNFVSPYDWKDVIQIDHSNTAQQEAMIDAMKFWVEECDIDGFRCDMAHLTPLDFWRKARTELDAVKPLFWLAETEHSSYHEVFDASYTWEFLHKMEEYGRGGTNIEGLDKVLQKYKTDFLFNAIRMFFTSNHDENSHSGSEYERMKDAAIPIAVLCATWDGIPLVYSGQELPVTKRLNFYNKDEIHWTGNNQLHDFYKTLLHLHSSHPALQAGDPETKSYRINSTNDENIFAFLRKKDLKEVLVILNLSSADLDLEMIDDRVGGSYQNVFTNEIRDFTSNKRISIKNWGYLVLVK